MNFCLSDLVPPLRWSDASTITLLTGQPDLPDAWWRSLPMPSVLAAIGPESLGELLTEIALEHWPAAAVGDVLPALHVLDPEEADEPAVAIALDRAGSWAGLLALTSRELVDQPFIQARPVLNTLFSAVLVRLAHPHGEEAPHAPHFAHEPAVHAAGPVADAREAVVEAREAEHAYAADEAEPAAAAPERGAVAEEAVPEPVAAQHAAEGADGERGDDEHRDGEHRDGERSDDAHSVPEPEHEPEPEREHEPAPFAQFAAVTPLFGQDARPEDEAHRPEAADVEQPEHHEPVPHEPVPHEPVPSEDAAPERDERVLDADAEPVSDEAPEEPEPERVLDAADEPAPEPAAQEASSMEAATLDPEDEDEPAQDERAEDEHERAGEDQDAAYAPVPDAPDEPAPDAAVHGQELPDLIEAAFAGLDDKTWAVAQNRVFTDEPSAVDQLAKLFAVPPAEIAATEDELRARLDRWLASEEAAPYRAHLDELVRTLGPEAPKEQLIGAADWHRLEIRALEVPAWQFVLTTLAPQPIPAQEVRVQQPDFPPPPLPQRKPHKQQPPQLPLEMAQSAFGPMPMPPPPPPGPPQFQAFTPVTPPKGETNGGIPEPHEHEPYQPLKDVSQTQRCFRQPDGRWWLRIDVTAEQLAGGECPLPTGFASYLGLSPGESRTVRSAAGELTMTWHGSPLLLSIERLLVDVGAREGGHLFLTLSDEGVLRARHLPVAAQGAEKITKALRLVGYTAPGGTRDQAARVIATRIGMTGPVALPDLLVRLRDRGDRDLLELLD